MKRILVLVLMLLSFVLASCEEEEHGRRYGYYGYPREGYRDGRYPDGYRDGYDGRRYRLMDETEQYGGTSQVESTVEP